MGGCVVGWVGFSVYGALSWSADKLTMRWPSLYIDLPLSFSLSPTIFLFAILAPSVHISSSLFLLPSHYFSLGGWVGGWVGLCVYGAFSWSADKLTMRRLSLSLSLYEYISVSPTIFLSAILALSVHSPSSLFIFPSHFIPPRHSSARQVCVFSHCKEASESAA